MPGSKERWSAEELRRYAKEKYPGILVKTNKPYSKGSAFIDPDTGEVLQEAESNFKLVEKETAPDAETLRARKRLPKLFEVAPEIRRKNYAEKMFSRGLCCIIEAMEISGLKNPRFVIGEDGFPEAIKVGNFEYDKYGMRKRGQLE
jgi:hypothetical protein